MSDIDRKKAEVRARLEAQAAGKKAKKGFMTPERKKKLRVSSSMTNYVYHCHCHYQLPMSLMNIEKLTKYCQIQPPIQTYLAGQTIRTRRAKVSKAWLLTF